MIKLIYFYFFGINLVLLSHLGELNALNFQQTGDGINPNIPTQLIECYNSSFITTQDNLLPMTIDSLIALIRKIEATIGTSMDVRTMSNAILCSYRFDGIRFDPSISSQLIMYGVEGNEFALWKLLYDRLNIGRSQMCIPDNVLTWVERCSLHRMLSMSVDIYPIGDENNQCSKLDRLKTFRYPREIAKLEDVEMINPKVSGESRIVNHPLDQAQAGNFVQVLGYDQSICPLEHGVIRTSYGDAIAPGIVLAGIAAGTQPQNIPPQSIFFMSPRRDGGSLKRKNPPNSYNPPRSSNNNPPPPGYRGNFKPNAYGNSMLFSQYDTNSGNNGQPFGGRDPYGNSGGGGGSIPGGRGVGNPTFFGGSNGNADGGTVFLRENLPQPSNIDNKYASTLAGELAYVSIWTGALQVGMQIGMSGGWNDSVIPKYYFQKPSSNYITPDTLTDARIRGSIDGLLLGKNVEDWVNVARGSLKLSQILSMYYSDKGVLSSDIKSCKRRDFYEQVAPISELQAQTYAVAYTLSELSPYPPNDLPNLANTAANYVRTYIASLRDPSCPSSDQNQIPTPAPVVDLYLVVDFTWAYIDITRLIQYTIDNLEIWKYGGNFTIINSKDGSTVIESSQSPVDLANNFTYSTYTAAPTGFDFTKLLSQLKARFQDKLEYDKQINSGGGIPRVVVFIPYASPSMSESERSSALYRLDYFKVKIPDVKFYYVVTGNKNSFSPFVSKDKDIFVVTPGSDIKPSLDPFISALATTPRRIINPNCGKSWSGSWYNEITMNGYLDSNEVHYYRVHPDYFFRGANAKVTILADGNTPILTICTSRDNPLPVANLSRTGSVSCKQITNGNRYELIIKESDCSSVYYATDCKPFYFSVANMQPPSKVQISIRCTDQECRDPDMTKYIIRHSGLTCYSGVSKLIISLPVLLIALSKIILF